MVMKIFENYNTAKQKYGIKMVQNFINLGLPPQYLLSACRFYNKLSLTPSEIVSKFRDWTKFVIKYQKYDVNKLTYNKFIELIENGKTNHLIPNILIKTDNAILGEINSPKDIENFSNENNWCIVSKKKFDTYVQKYGYKFFVIFMPKEPRPLTYVIVAIHDGER